MKILLVRGIIAVTAITAVCLTAMGGNDLIAVPPNAVVETEVSAEFSELHCAFRHVR